MLLIHSAVGVFNAHGYGMAANIASIGLPAWTLPLVIADPVPLRIAAALLAVVGTSTLLGLHIGTARHFRVPIWYGLLFPLGYVFGASLALHAIWWRARGHVLWKDRAYTTAPDPSDHSDPPGSRANVL